MKWDIIFYEKENGEVPLEQFLDSLPPKHLAKALWEIDLLSIYGINLREPYVKYLVGEEYKGLWELRIKFASNISRIFYFLHMENQFVLLHGFIKKTEQTPKREMDMAKKYMEDHKRRVLE